jgi:pimeloyl-[acyl-carrier protein] methyl ester esterase
MPRTTFQEFATSVESDANAALLRFVGLHLGAGPAERALVRELRGLLAACALPPLAALRAGLRVLEQSDLRAALPSIEQPALVLHGRDDRLVPVAAAEFLAQRLPQARAAYFDGAGHAPFLSRRDATIDALREFLA